LRYVKRDLIKKIEKDTGMIIPIDSTFCRTTQSKGNLSGGAWKWFWMEVLIEDKRYIMKYRNIIIGSGSNMSDLLKCEKIYCDYGNSQAIDRNECSLEFTQHNEFELFPF